jgi:hypothetical protein
MKEVIKHSAYNLDLLPFNFNIFGPWKTAVQGCTFPLKMWCRRLWYGHSGGSTWDTQTCARTVLMQKSVAISFSCCNTFTSKHLQTGLVVHALSILKITNCVMQGSHFIPYKFHIELTEFNILHVLFHSRKQLRNIIKINQIQYRNLSQDV